MKKIALLGVCLFLVNVTFPQQTRVEFGLKGGVNFATLKSDVNSGSEARTGFHVGGLAHIHMSPHFALQPEIVFSTQGAAYGSDREDKLSYINVPVLGQFMFGRGFRLQTGPQLGFRVDAASKNNETETDLKDAVKKTDFSWSLGAGYLSPVRLGIDARYNLGLNTISKTTAASKNRVWQVGIFYQFRH